MTFAELVRRLGAHGFELRRQNGSKRFYAKAAFQGSYRSTFMARRKSPQGPSARSSRTPRSKGKAPLGPCGLRFGIEIEETDDPRFYGVTVPDILGCTTTGRSIEHAIANAREAIDLHLRYLAEEGLPLPRPRRPVEIRIIARRVGAAA
jgi:predicted RNase H-like HicB family nuclease